MKNTLFTVFIYGILLSGFAHAQTGNWQLAKTASTIAARSECSLVAVEGKLYLIGGDGPAMAVEQYDPATRKWSKKADAPSTMHHFQAVGLGGKVYVLDAFSTTNYPDQVPLGNVYSYDTQKDTWKKLTEIPEDRRRGGAGEAVYNGKLYIVCGITHGHRSGTNAMFDCYDPSTDKWTSLPDAPHIRDHSQAVVVGDKLYALGGRNTSLHDADNFMSFFDKVVLEVDCYDFKTGQWSTLPQKLPMGTGGGTAVNLDGKIFFIGGERATSTKPNGPQKDVFMLDPSISKEWERAATLNKARNGVGGAVLNHKIYIAGGAGGPGGPPPIGKPGMPNQKNPPPPGGNPPNAINPATPPPPGSTPLNGQPPMPPRNEKSDIALEVFSWK